MLDKIRRLLIPQRRIKPKDPMKASADLRSLVLHMKPEQIGVSRSEAMPNVWGAIMEIGMSGSVVTVVSLADGTTSMYFSSGGESLAQENTRRLPLLPKCSSTRRSDFFP